jgi:hypothetical protein
MQLVCPVNRPDRPSGVDDVEIVSDVGRKAGEHLIELIDHVVDEPCRDGKILTERDVERRLQPGTERDIRGNSVWYGIVAAVSEDRHIWHVVVPPGKEIFIGRPH